LKESNPALRIETKKISFSLVAFLIDNSNFFFPGEIKAVVAI